MNIVVRAYTEADVDIFVMPAMRSAGIREGCISARSW